MNRGGDICKKYIATIIEDKIKIAKVFPWVHTAITWVHTAISNANKKLLGLHHHVKDNYMQNCVGEFGYKFNRRYFGENLFDRLVIATMQKSWHDK